jgi:hypothetical protein
MSDLSIFNRMIQSAGSPGVKIQVLNQMHQDMESYVPKRAGFLRSQSFVNNTGVHYTAKYARAQFYGLVNGHRVRNYSTPGTSRRWDLRAKAVYMSDWQKAAASAYLKEAKGGY